SAWKKIKPDKALREKILHGLVNAKEREEWQREGGRFIPMAAAWLDGQRWEDEDLCRSRDRPRGERHLSTWDSSGESASYGNSEDFFELALKRSYEKMRE
ncbi:MAG: hypothetical protein J6Q78_01180, partial [Clostridia bacterium]|nr:hypothetical protein [Clostridia bacterium]